MMVLSRRFFHSSFIHSTGTSGLSFSTAPQQHTRQSATWATRTRFVCMEKATDGTILGLSFSSVRCLGARNRALAAKARQRIYLSAEGAGQDEPLRCYHLAIRG